MDLKFIAVKIALPVIIYLSMALSIPYIFAYGLVPWLTNFGMFTFCSAVELPNHITYGT